MIPLCAIKIPPLFRKSSRFSICSGRFQMVIKCSVMIYFLKFLMPPPRIGVTPICPQHISNLFYKVIECSRSFQNILECSRNNYKNSRFLMPPPPMGLTPICPHQVYNLFYEVLECSRMFYHDFIFLKFLMTPPPWGLRQFVPSRFPTFSMKFQNVLEGSRMIQNVLL